MSEWIADLRRLFTDEVESDQDSDPVCTKCGEVYELLRGEPSRFCDSCAQELVSDIPALLDALEAARRALGKIDAIRNSIIKVAIQARADADEMHRRAQAAESVTAEYRFFVDRYKIAPGPYQAIGVAGAIREELKRVRKDAWEAGRDASANEANNHISGWTGPRDPDCIAVDTRIEIVDAIRALTPPSDGEGGDHG